VPGKSLFAELRERKVPQAAAIYVAVAWGVTEIAVTIVEQLFLPQWVATLAVIVFVVGFPIAMFLAWTFDITSGGIERTEVTSRRGQASIAFAILLLMAGTASLFLLIKPSMQDTVEPTGAMPVAPNSIAVLPFDNASSDPDDAYLSEGLSDELRDQLGRVADLRIAARSSSLAASDQGMDAMTASANLSVAHIVEGSLRRQGDRVRVSVQLIEGRTGLSVWSDTFERGARELLVVQQSIADEIVRRVLPDIEQSASEPATRNADANELMLLAKHYENQVRSRAIRDDATLLKSISLYRQATEADPESALAHSRLAGALLYLGDLAAAEAPIFRALSLNPNLAEVQNTLGQYYWARGLPGARAAYRRAVELDPHFAPALANYANEIWVNPDDLDISSADPESYFRRALEVDPLSLERLSALGTYLGQDGQFDEVMPVIQEIRELFDNAESYRVIAWLYELLGELDVAIAWTIRARDLEPQNRDHVSKLADLYSLIGDAETALRLEPEPGPGLLFNLRRYDELIDIAEMRMIEEPSDADIRYLLGFAYMATRQHEQAIRILGSTGLLDSMLDTGPRSVIEIEAFQMLVSAMAASDIPEAVETARALAEWQDEFAYWGDVGWVALFKGCNKATLGEDQAVLELLPGIKESSRLRRDAYLRDFPCFERFADEPVYRDVLRDQDARRASLRQRLPGTLAEFGVSL
jgi:TolB-like protein/tetratricopeptide (TPR) repeat protein